MANLMEGSYTYKSLTKKYNSFFVPVFKITINEKNVVEQLKIAIENLSISLSIDNAGACSFNIVNAYNNISRSFDNEILSEFRLGSIIEIELGYSSSIVKVFKGYVSNVGVDFSEEPTISIKAMDVRRLMMDRKCCEKLVVRNYSDAFSQIVKNYQKLISETVIDSTEEKIKSQYQIYSDFVFLQGIAKKAYREFFVVVDKVYFRNPENMTKSPITTLKWGESLITFSRDSMYNYRNIKVIGFDEEKKESVEAEVSSRSDDSIRLAANEIPTEIFTETLAEDEKKAKKRAEAEAEERKRKSQSGSGSCIGLPELVPGRYIGIINLDPKLDTKYYITSVKHSFGTSGFTSSFTIGGWE